MRILLAISLLFTTACGGSQTFDPLPLIINSVQGGQVVSQILASNALESEAWEACVAATVTGAALAATESAIADSTEIPQLSVDVSECLQFNPDFEPGDSTLPSATRPIDAAVASLAAINSFLGIWEVELCEKAPAVFVIQDYLDGAIPEILSEILAPDGVVVIPPTALVSDVCE